MQCQLLFVEMFSLAEVFACAFCVSFGRMCGVFNLQDALLLGKSLEATRDLLGPPQLSCCCIFGQKSAGMGWGRGSASTGDAYCTRSVIPEGALGSWEWVKGDVSGCSFYLHVLCPICRVTKTWRQLFRQRRG